MRSGALSSCESFKTVRINLALYIFIKYIDIDCFAVCIFLGLELPGCSVKKKALGASTTPRLG